MKKWSIEAISSLNTKTILMTGGTSGEGLEAARVLCTHGARLVLCSDDIFQAERAVNIIHLSCPEANVHYEHVDLGDLNSVIEFSERFTRNYGSLDVLINNAEIKHQNGKMLSVQGHELMWTYNYLSHFVLTAKLFNLLGQAQEGRIIFQSHLNHQTQNLDLFDLESEYYYRPRKAFGQSKLALLIFSRELDRRMRAIHLNVKSIPIHLGGGALTMLSNFFHLNFSHHKLQASVPMLYAATADEATSGHYYGPPNIYEVWGMPSEKDFATQAKNLQVAEELWNLTVEMTGVEFKLLDLTNVVKFRKKQTSLDEFFT